MIRKIKQFTIDINFTNALKAMFSALIPFYIFSRLGHSDIGLTMAIGALFTFPSDTPSNLKHKINGILVTVWAKMDVVVVAVVVVEQKLPPWPR